MAMQWTDLSLQSAQTSVCNQINQNTGAIDVIDSIPELDESDVPLQTLLVDSCPCSELDPIRSLCCKLVVDTDKSTCQL